MLRWSKALENCTRTHPPTLSFDPQLPHMLWCVCAYLSILLICSRNNWYKPVWICNGDARTPLVVVVAGKKAETEKSGEEEQEQEG